ncbi:MAG TPA: serine protease [Verrucomicrobiae bacterium]|nr:serine protease [Verrucomicrobiae bacterium]
MKCSTYVSCLAVAVAGVWATVPAQADDAAKAGRDILAKYQNAVVTVKLAIKQSMSMGGRESKTESKTETTGTIIDPSGLTVVSLMTTDPGSAVKEAYARAMVARGGDPSELKFESELSDAKIVLADGTELAANVVLRDKDLDLAYLRPSEKPVEAGKRAQALPYVDLARSAKPQMLDQVIVLNRLSKVANRVPAVSVGRIEGVVDKPRTFYVLGQAMWSYALGAPVFTLDGRLVGILFLRIARTQTDQNNGFMFSNLSQWGMMPIILPASDVGDEVKQALEAKIPAAEEKPSSEKPALPGKSE